MRAQTPSTNCTWGHGRNGASRRGPADRRGAWIPNKGTGHCSLRAELQPDDCASTWASTRSTGGASIRPSMHAHRLRWTADQRRYCLGHRSSALASSRLAFRIEIEPTAPESRKSAIRCERPSPATVRTVSSPARLRSTILSANALNLDGSPTRSRCIASTCSTSVPPEVSFCCSPTASASSTGMRSRCCGSLRPAPAPSHRAAATSASWMSVWTRNTDMGS